MMAVKLTREVLINGTVYGPGKDIAGIATPGEITSLVSQGFARKGRGKRDQEEPPADDPESDSDPEPTDSPAPAEDEPASESVDSLDLDDRTRGQLIDAGLDTVDKVRDYLAEHCHFRGVTGIGKVGDANVKAALGE